MYATSFDHGSISYGGGDSNASFEMRSRDNPTHLDSVDRFVRFIKFFRRGEQFYYSDQLKKNFGLSNYYLEVRLEDVASLDADLASNISSKPQEFLTLVLFIS
jgi:DNA replication licensing factor MCM5